MLFSSNNPIAEKLLILARGDLNVVMEAIRKLVSDDGRADLLKIVQLLK